jgi:hypothetical protein
VIILKENRLMGLAQRGGFVFSKCLIVKPVPDVHLRIWMDSVGTG